jgi:hypothetical protein
MPSSDLPTIHLPRSSYAAGSNSFRTKRPSINLPICLSFHQRIRGTATVPYSTHILTRLSSRTQSDGCQKNPAPTREGTYLLGKNYSYICPAAARTKQNKTIEGSWGPAFFLSFFLFPACLSGCVLYICSFLPRCRLCSAVPCKNDNMKHVKTSGDHLVAFRLPFRSQQAR